MRERFKVNDYAKNKFEKVSMQKDTENIVWHEFGHLIIDTLLINEFKDIEITKYEIGKNTGGKVKIEKKNKEIINIFESKRLLCYTIVSLSFGAILEAIYWTKNLKYTEPYELLNGGESGESDWGKIKIIQSKIKHNNFNEIMKEYVLDIYSLILNNDDLYKTISLINEEIMEKLYSFNKTEDLVFKLNKETIKLFSSRLISNKLNILIREIQSYLEAIENSIKNI